jgi:hypothetical protein
MRNKFLLVVGVFFLGAVSCARARASAGSNRNVITQEEIVASNAATAYDVIARLRADFLRDRGPTSLLLPNQHQPVVFLRDQLYGQIDQLREFRSSDLAEIRFYPGPDAVTKFGSQYSGGVIQLLPRAQ